MKCSPWTIDANKFKNLSLLFIVDENVPVQNTQCSKNCNEDQGVNPDQFEDAAMPDQHHLPETLTGLLGIFITVRENVGPLFWHCGKIELRQNMN